MPSPGEQLMRSGVGRWLMGTVGAWEGDGVDGLMSVRQLATGEALCTAARAIDPRVAAVLEVRPHGDPSDPKGAADTVGRRRIEAVLEAVTHFYQECLGVVVLMELPIVPVIVDNPESEAAVAELHRLLLLMLGCAVRGYNKQQHVDLLKSFDPHVQYDLKEALESAMRSELPALTSEDLATMPVEDLTEALRAVRGPPRSLTLAHMLCRIATSQSAVFISYL